VSRSFPLVLCYHAATDDWDHALATPARRIVSQIELLLRLRWRPLRLDDVLSARGRYFHVTFDDAFRSAARVLPELERLEVPATVFACGAYAEEGAPLTIPELAAAPRDEVATMRWPELVELAARGVAVESHTLTHPHLARLSDVDLDRELRDSRERIESRLGKPCRFLAYPFGEHDARVRRAAERAGYHAAFAVRSRQHPLDRFAFPRVGVYARSRLLLKASLPARHAAGLRGSRAVGRQGG
jgi:peptidoglycan/xylan/chitin deacetylase (PgdA/CDA1 family)